MKKIRILIIVMALVAIGFMVWWLSAVNEVPEYKTDDARVRSISKMVELCTTDIHEEIPVKDSINGKWLVARQVVEGRIRFDIERLRTDVNGDTLTVYLPPERVDILESAGADGYEVLDTWDGRSMLFARTLTAAEENKIKERWQQRVRKRVYDRGYVRHARKEAVARLSALLNTMRRNDNPEAVVIVEDPTPEGNF